MSDESRSAGRQRYKGFFQRRYRRNKRIVFWLTSFLVVVIAFVAGFFFRADISLMEKLGIPVEESAESASASSSTKLKTTYESLSMRISEVEDMLSAYSFDDIDLSDATSEMLNALMESTQDPFAAYFDAASYDKYLKENTGVRQDGIGVLFGEYEGRAYAIDVLEGSQAQAEGVQQGDFVVSIDGVSSKQWSSSAVIGALAHDVNSSAVVTWMRPISLDAQSGEEFTTTLEVRDYVSENIETELVDEVGYIRLRQFTSSSAFVVKEAVEGLLDQGAKAFVLDLSDNPGGYLSQSIDIASMFIQSGVVVGIETVDGTSSRTVSGKTLTQMPMTVIINSYTSGVAEVLAAALKDSQRATLIGQQTVGKGSVQVTRELSFGGAIRYTAAYYLTPLGHKINGVGITPDVVVVNQPDSSEDMQKVVAIEAARSMVESGS